MILRRLVVLLSLTMMNVIVPPLEQQGKKRSPAIDYYS